MTTEEKAKAYDNALKVIEKYKDANIMFTQGLKEELFPELKESEDEKIVKAILATIRQGIDTEEVLENNGVSYEDVETWLKEKTLKSSYEDEEVRKQIKAFVKSRGSMITQSKQESWIAWLEKQKYHPVPVKEETGALKQLIDDEDEKIRKELIEYCQVNMGHTWHDIKQENFIAWLEKQGEHAENNEDDVDIDFTVYHPLKNGKGIYECIPYSFYGTLSSFDEDKDMIDFLHLCFYTEEECNEWIKQNKSTDTCDSLIIKSKEFPASEKRDFGYFSEPTNKVEPKFHEGDWVVTDKNNVVQIKAIENGKYVLENIMRFTVDYVDKCWRKWTIQDAKEGDVLVDDLGNICIYQEPSTKLMYHSFCYGKHKYFIDCGGSHKIVGTCPATKEQCGLLFQKMREAEYEWDGEKKELKRIEQKPAEWSKDDIEMIENLIRCCEKEYNELCNDKYGHEEIVSDLKRDCRKKWDWLESLKNRLL